MPSAKTPIAKVKLNSPAVLISCICHNPHWYSKNRVCNPVCPLHSTRSVFARVSREMESIFKDASCSRLTSLSNSRFDLLCHGTLPPGRTSNLGLMKPYVRFKAGREWSPMHHPTFYTLTRFSFHHPTFDRTARSEDLYANCIIW